MPMLQESRPPLHENFASASTAQSLAHVEPAAFERIRPARNLAEPAGSATPHRAGPAGGPPRLSFVVVLIGRMINRSTLMGRGHCSKLNHHSTILSHWT